MRLRHWSAKNWLSYCLGAFKKKRYPDMRKNIGTAMRPKLCATNSVVKTYRLSQENSCGIALADIGTTCINSTKTIIGKRSTSSTVDNWLLWLFGIS